MICPQLRNHARTRRSAFGATGVLRCPDASWEARAASLSCKISKRFSVASFLLASVAKTGTFVALGKVDKSIYQEILCGETQSRKVMSAGGEQIKLALN